MTKCDLSFKEGDERHEESVFLDSSAEPVKIVDKDDGKALSHGE